MKVTLEPKAKRVEVEWVDSASRGTRWHDIVDLETDLRVNGLERVVTIAWLVMSSPEAIVLASDIQLDRRDGTVCRVGGVLEIPRGCVIAMRRVPRVKGSPIP